MSRQVNKKRVLVVDDYPGIRDTLAAILNSAGYDVSTANDGFTALLYLKKSAPELILSDLSMPNMSGFEFLSVVRRRFPQMLVVAMSGAYGSAASVPGGAIADAFYAKNISSPEKLLKIVADVFQRSESEKLEHLRQPAPVWIPRNGKNSHGIPYVVLSCTDCLRSFPVNVPAEARAR